MTVRQCHVLDFNGAQGKPKAAHDSAPGRENSVSHAQRKTAMSTLESNQTLCLTTASRPKRSILLKLKQTGGCNSIRM